MKLRHLSITCILLLLVCGFGYLSAQEGKGIARLIGFVYDEEKNPLSGVKVTLEYIAYPRKLETVSNDKGKWIFATLGKGSVKLIFEKSGYLPTMIALEVSGISQNNKPQIATLIKPKEIIDPQSQKNTEFKNKLLQAEALFKDKKYQQALDLYTSIKEAFPDFTIIRIDIGYCFLELKQYDQAETEFNAVLNDLQSKPQNDKLQEELSQVYAGLGDLFMRQDKMQYAEEYFKKAIEIDAKNHLLAYNVAEILFSAGKTDEAIKYYQLTIGLNPTWPNSYRQLGYAYLNQGNTAKAIESLKKYLELAKDSSDAAAIEEVIRSLK